MRGAVDADGAAVSRGGGVDLAQTETKLTEEKAHSASLSQKIEEINTTLATARKENEALDKLVEQHHHCLSVPRHLHSLQHELILMSHLNVMVTMDSANMHLASLVATPVVSIWGATHPYAGFMGWNQSIDNALQVDLPCRPCSIYGKKDCMRGDYACLNQISPETIVGKIERILQ